MSVEILNPSIADYTAPEGTQKVHNHILETKIYTSVGENAVIHTRPSSIHFQGFQAGNCYSKKLRIINASSESQRIHIIPPTTNAFSIKYKKKDHGLVPGMYLEVTVYFHPQENAYHADNIRIHCKGNSNLVVPLHAYLIMDTSKFPREIVFKPTLIGKSETRSVPLYNNSPASFQFQITCSQRNPSFDVAPTQGTIPADGKIDISVTFSPKEYATAVAQIQLLVSQFNARPINCNLIGKSEPGLAKRLKEKELDRNTIEKSVDPRSLSPLERSRNKRNALAEKQSRSNTNMPSEEPKVIVKDGIRFPVHLTNHAAVANVLAQEPGKLRTKELKAAVRTQDPNLPPTKQMKEAMFQNMVNENVAEEERNQLRWCVKLGDESIIEKAGKKILAKRQKNIDYYHVARGDPQLQQEFSRYSNNLIAQGVYRRAQKNPTSTAKFDLFLNDEWGSRRLAAKRFIQAARRVIVIQRVANRAKKLAKHLVDWRCGNFFHTQAKMRQQMNTEFRIVEELNTSFPADSVKPYALVEYHDPDVKDDMAMDALGNLSTNTTFVHVKNKTEIYNLKAAQQYKLLSYDRHRLTRSVKMSVPKKITRIMRTGAEDEIISLEMEDQPALDTNNNEISNAMTEKVDERKTSLPASEGRLPSREARKTSHQSLSRMDASRMGVSEPSAVAEEELQDLLREQQDVINELPTTMNTPYEQRGVEVAASGCVLPLPQEFLQPRLYHHMHIFNPCPGLESQPQPLPYSEMDEDYRLCPLPRSSQRVKLDKEDVIPGIMSWKKFASHASMVLNLGPTLSNVYVPRWSEPIDTELCSMDVPPLLEALPDDDAEIATNDEADSALVANMEMVEAEFKIQETLQPADDESMQASGLMSGNALPQFNNLATSSGRISREQRVMELDALTRNKMNVTGERIRANIQALQNDWTLDSIHE